MAKRCLSGLAAVVVYFCSASLALAQEGGGETDEPGWWEKLLRDFMCWLLGLGLELAAMFGEWFEGYVPKQLVQGFAALVNTIGNIYPIVNAWLPVEWFFTLIGGYYAFALLIIVYRAVKSWIPGMGG
jgi:hypothetical protein